MMLIKRGSARIIEPIIALISIVRSVLIINLSALFEGSFDCPSGGWWCHIPSVYHLDDVRIQLHECRHNSLHALHRERPLTDGSVGNGHVHDVLCGEVVLWWLRPHSTADVCNNWVFQVTSERTS